MSARAPYFIEENIGATNNGIAHIFEEEERHNCSSYTFQLESNPFGNNFTAKFQFCFESAENVQTALNTDQAAQDALNWFDWEFGNLNQVLAEPKTLIGRPVAWRAVSVSGAIHIVVTGTPAQ